MTLFRRAPRIAKKPMSKAAARKSTPIGAEHNEASAYSLEPDGRKRVLGVIFGAPKLAKTDIGNTALKIISRAFWLSDFRRAG